MAIGNGCHKENWIASITWVKSGDSVVKTKECLVKL